MWEYGLGDTYGWGKPSNKCSRGVQLEYYEVSPEDGQEEGMKEDIEAAGGCEADLSFRPSSAMFLYGNGMPENEYKSFFSEAVPYTPLTLPTKSTGSKSA